jgi:class 3 adenylate cyclase
MVQRYNIRHETELETGIGSGAVAVGVFGHRSLKQKDVFGEEVNRAVVIGHHRGIAITENVYGKVKATYPTNRLPDKAVKWQDEPLKVWEIVER